ncbi:FAD-dependent oxidoreductase [Aromatoleum buckelii]|uniref:FAD-dependent oxidoreductase n=1 Tax=Aromatoleum buckelii TaxID=200254 RepID=A0ABX1N6N0_9RHOO|nr:FAD-dependent oxidoreductase [Aromatoleum buckelii]MCK0512768.1 FAD-binding oxidoreductase [Aromatoleum buckelii]
MTGSNDVVDALIIGGGFYGATIAIYLAKQRGLRRITLVEREPKLLRRASYHNQARVHNGYHYPRSFTTAFRSRVNLPKFLRDWPQAVTQDFMKLYAIAKRNSKVTARQFERFCHDIGARVNPAETGLKRLFDPGLIEDVFLVEEYVFDATRLAQWAEEELRDNGVVLRVSTRATAISRSLRNELLVTVMDQNGHTESLNCRYVFNCTYSGLNQFLGEFPGTQTGLKQEVTEMALMRMPEALQDVGVTVMDGPFFSIMPFPARDLHTLSHVRYTPHFSWKDEPGTDPYRKLSEYDRASRADRMVRDVARYLPSVLEANYIESLFEVKTVLVKNEGDDGRPILFEKHAELPGCYSILGGKIDNIYDVLEKLETEEFRSTLE